MSEPEFITIVVPALNEEAYIERAVKGLVLDDGQYEILVMDGGSSDRTVEIVRGLAAEGLPVKAVHNPRRTQAAALNISAEVADPCSRYLVRADAHCAYPRNFARLVADTLARTAAQSVVVPMETMGDENCFQAANAAAQNSVLGNGGSAHRRKAVDAGWTDHGHHAGFDRAFYRFIGGYDELFVTNQDAEYDIRVHKAGGRVWLEPSALIAYFPRKTAWSLARQYYRHGRGRAMTVAKHSARMKTRQLAPAAAFMACAAGVLASPLCPATLAVPAGYAALCLSAGAYIAWRKGLPGCAAAMGVPAMIMHMSWGAGFLLKAARLAPRARRALRGEGTSWAES